MLTVHEFACGCVANVDYDMLAICGFERKCKSVHEYNFQNRSDLVFQHLFRQINKDTEKKK